MVDCIHCGLPFVDMGDHRDCRESRWPVGLRFKYGDPVHVVQKRPGQPRFPGHVVGWYKPIDGRHFGYVIEHERDGIIHVNPDAALAPGLGITTSIDRLKAAGFWAAVDHLEKGERS